MERNVDQDSTLTGDPAETGVVEEKRPGSASGLTCPECQGSIWELRNGDSVRFECRVGHAYGPDAFVAAQGERVESALWTAINTLEERASTFVRLARLSADPPRQATYEERAAETTRQADVLRELLYSLVRSGDVG